MSRIALATLTRGMEFVARTGSDHEVRMDAREESGGKNLGPRPAELPYVGLAGCTGMDVISILRKMRQDVATFQVEVEGVTKTEEHPKRWSKIRVIFTVTGEVEAAKLERAIDLSRTRYCGVSDVMRPAIEIEYVYVLNGDSHTMAPIEEAREA
ncbi:OsmC family protein [bacterium]|nr:OsmC family protein [bacterium]